MDEDDQPAESVRGSCRTFAFRTTAHGLKRVAGARGRYKKILWAIIVCMAVSGFTYHSIYLILNYLEFPRITTTEEIHANVMEFPAVTVCNLNPLKNTFVTSYLNYTVDDVTQSEEIDNESEEEDTICYRSIDEFLRRSKTMDLSDMWMSLIATKDNLIKYGHQAQDMIAQCTYNLRNCFNPRRSYPVVDISDYPNPRFGLCHTIVISSNNKSDRFVTKPGSPFGLRLTLNIERNQYLDILTADYGARLVVHQPGTFPTIQEGGVVLQPGTKTYVGARMRKMERLPKPYRGCDETIEQSLVGRTFKKFGARYLNQFKVYSYEYCEVLCKESRLLEKCGCLEELTLNGNMTCDVCNASQVKCRSGLYKKFSSATRLNACQKMCLPACHDTRYDLTISQAEWPNANHQKLVLERRPKINARFRHMINITDEDVARKNFSIDVPYLKNNFLRVVIFLQDQNYLSISDQPAVTLPQLFANLGGCLGLYIGVSAITIVEILEQFTIIATYLYQKRVSTADLNYFLFGTSKRKAPVKRRALAIKFHRQPNVFVVNETSNYQFQKRFRRDQRTLQDVPNHVITSPYPSHADLAKLPGYTGGGGLREPTQYWDRPPYPPSYDGYYYHA